MDTMVNEQDDILLENDLGRVKASVRVGNGCNEFVGLEAGVWDYGSIVSALVRHKYSADCMEAIVNNSLMLLRSVDGVSVDGADVKMSELDDLQHWRELCKQRAKRLLEIGARMGL